LGASKLDNTTKHP